MPEPGVVIVECDRCHRPVTRLDKFGFPFGPMYDSGESYVAVRLGPIPGAELSNRWAGKLVGGHNRPGTTDGPNRFKLVCPGRKHPREERPVTLESLQRAHRRAVEAGRSRIGMREIRR